MLALLLEYMINSINILLFFSGESVLNDAIGITVFNVTSKFVGSEMDARDIIECFVKFCIVFSGSCFIGYALGILTAYWYRKIGLRPHKLIVVAVFVLTVYIPFLLSEMLQLR